MGKSVRRIAGYPPYEVSTSPWFGPTKRAAEFLADAPLPIDPHGALAAMKETLGDSFQNLQHVRIRRLREERQRQSALCHRGVLDAR
jgi:hypothetical protein